MGWRRLRTSDSCRVIRHSCQSEVSAEAQGLANVHLPGSEHLRGRTEVGEARSKYQGSMVNVNSCQY